MRHYFVGLATYEPMSFEGIFRRHYEFVTQLEEQKSTDSSRIKEINCAFEKEQLISEKLYYFFRRYKKYFTKHQFVQLARYATISAAVIEGGSLDDFRDRSLHDRPGAAHFYCCRSLNHETLYIGLDVERKESVLPQRWGVVGKRELCIYTSQRRCLFLATIFEEYVADDSEPTWVYAGAAVQRFVAGKWLEHLGAIFDQIKIAADVEALQKKSMLQRQEVANFMQKSA